MGGKAMDMLEELGFQGTLLNGMGVDQWTEAGYDLVATDSIPPEIACSANTSVTGKECTNFTTDLTAMSTSGGNGGSGAAAIGGSGAAAILHCMIFVVASIVLAVRS